MYECKAPQALISAIFKAWNSSFWIRSPTDLQRVPLISKKVRISTVATRLILKLAPQELQNILSLRLNASTRLVDMPHAFWSWGVIMVGSKRNVETRPQTAHCPFSCSRLSFIVVALMLIERS